MKPEWCPQWAWDEADRLADASSKYWHDIYWGGQSDITLNEHVARAILEAHQRGRREGMEEAAEVVRQQVPTIPGDGPTDPIQEAEYFALGHTLIAIRAKAQEVAS